MRFFNRMHEMSSALLSHVTDYKVIYGTVFCLLYLMTKTNALTLDTDEGIIEVPTFIPNSDDTVIDNCFYLRVYEHLCELIDGISINFFSNNNTFDTQMVIKTLEEGQNVFCIAARHFKSLMCEQELSDCYDLPLDTNFRV